MNGRLFAALFAIICLMGVAPALLGRMSGLASAGLAAGFMMPVETTYHMVAWVATGFLAAWLNREATVLLPLCALLMLAIGAMMQVDEPLFRAVQMFIVGAILLFALNVSLLRRQACLLGVPPVAGWAYFAGSGYMHAIPSMATPLYFLLGITASVAMMMAIGVSLGIVLTQTLHDAMGKFGTLRPVSTLRSLF